MQYSIPDQVTVILDKFAQANFQIYIVGGAVRDLLMSREVTDWDFTTDAKPAEILQLFPDAFYTNKFGTVGLPSNLGIMEITTMRKEGIYKDHRHTIEVSWTNQLKENFYRRDFTINAMALSQGGELTDLYQGQQDLENKLIRAVGDPNLRFFEDALRMIKAFRMVSQIEFDIEKNTFESIIKNGSLIGEIAWERIRDELFKLLSGMNPYISLVKMKESGVLKIILPEIESCFGVVQEGPKHDRVYDIGEHSLLTLKYCPSPDPLVRLAALLHDIGKVETMKVAADGNVTFYQHDLVGANQIKQITRRLNLSNEQTDKLYRLVRWHLFTVDENLTDKAIRRFIKNVGVENIEDMLNLRIADRLGGGTQKAVSWRMEKFQERIKQVLQQPFSIADLKINGKDIMDTLNIQPGKQVGDILQKLFSEVEDNSSKKTHDYLLKRIREFS